MTSNFGQVFSSTPQSKYQKWFLKPVTGLSSPSSIVIFIKEHRLSKIDAGLKPVLRLTSYFSQVFPTTPQICTQNDFSNWLLVWAPRFHLLFFLKGYASTKINSGLKFTRNDAGLKPLLQMTSNFGQVFSSTSLASTQNGHSNRSLVWAPNHHL
jgi:hypothetical protein